MQHQPNVDFNQTTPVTCDECGNPHFVQNLVIRKVPGLLTGQREASYIPIPVFACTKCGHVNEAFKPKEEKRLE
jgi:uncharacterized Zn finger protein